MSLRSNEPLVPDSAPRLPPCEFGSPLIILAPKISRQRCFYLNDPLESLGGWKSLGQAHKMTHLVLREPKASDMKLLVYLSHTYTHQKGKKKKQKTQSSAFSNHCLNNHRVPLSKLPVPKNWVKFHDTQHPTSSFVATIPINKNYHQESKHR